jgi:hypothetical protein
MRAYGRRWLLVDKRAARGAKAEREPVSAAA